MRQQITDQSARPVWPFGELVPMRYGVILADPPWSYEMYSDKGYEKSPDAHYDTMLIDELRALPVDHLAAPDCLLFMWAVWPMLPQALELMRAWRFEFRTGGAWLKRTSGGKTAFGTGYVLRSATEPFLVGVLGAPPYSGQQRKIRNVIETVETAIEAVRREHSRKPPEQYEILERILPHAFKVELFARPTRPGWSAWGKEVGKFDGAAP